MEMVSKGKQVQWKKANQSQQLEKTEEAFTSVMTSSGFEENLKSSMFFCSVYSTSTVQFNWLTFLENLKCPRTIFSEFFTQTKWSNKTVDFYALYVAASCLLCCVTRAGMELSGSSCTPWCYHNTILIPLLIKKHFFFSHNSCTEVDFATFVGGNVRSFTTRVFISLKKIPFSIKISMPIFLFCSWITNIKTEEQVRFGCDLPVMFFKLTLTCKWTCMCIAGLRIVNNYAHKKAMLLKCSSVLE